MSDHTPLKRCSKCGNEFPSTTQFFNRNKSRPDNLQYWCRKCQRVGSKISDDKHREEKRRKGREYQRKIHEADPGMNHRVYVQRRQKYIASNLRWRANNPEKVRAIARKGSKKNWARVYAQNSKRRARKMGAGGQHTPADIRRIYKAQKGKCYWCGVKVGKTYHVDHVIPLARGGTDGPENLVIACPDCNRHKHDKLPHEWSGSGGKLL